MEKLQLPSWLHGIERVAFDVYGTIVSSHVNNPDSRVLRPNALDLIKIFYSYGIPMVTSSDANIERIVDLFKELRVDSKYFQRMYKMIPGQKKDYTPILSDYNLAPKNLLVIGNNYHIDIEPAKELGCQTVFVPEEFPSQEIPKRILSNLKLRCFFHQDLTRRVSPRTLEQATN